MNSADDMDLEAMISNPFQFIKTAEGDNPEPELPPEQEEPGSDVPAPPAPLFAAHTAPSRDRNEFNVDRIGHNHPLELRLLGLEKNQINWDKKVAMLKEIVERQNERIDLLEKELDLLRKPREEQHGAEEA